MTSHNLRIGAAAIVLAAMLPAASLAKTPVDASELRQLTTYVDADTAWSDQNSDIALWWPRPTESGLQSLSTMTSRASVTLGAPDFITDRLLQWLLKDETGKPLTLQLLDRSHGPDKVVERDRAGDIDLMVTAAFVSRDAVRLEFKLRNRSSEPKKIVLSFSNPALQAAPLSIKPIVLNEIVPIATELRGSWSVITPHAPEPDAPLDMGDNSGTLYPPWVGKFTTGIKAGSVYELVQLSDLSDRAVALPAGGEALETVLLSFGKTRGTAHDVERAAEERIAAGWTAATATAEWQERLSALPELPLKYAAPKYRQLYLHAAAQLHSLFVRGTGGFTGTKRIPFVAKGVLNTAFDGDMGGIVRGAVIIDPRLGEEAFESFTDNVSPRGSLPAVLADSFRNGEGIAPMDASSAAWRVFKADGNLAWLRRVYPGLSANANYWLSYRLSSRGLAMYSNSCEIADNDVRFDQFTKSLGAKAYCIPVSGIESPDLNAFLVNDMRHLALMADALTLPQDAMDWRRKADGLAAKIVETMYFPEESRFRDVKEGTHVKASDANIPNYFLPLWAGVPLPREEIRKVIERHMLNPDEFYRPLPYPSLAYDHPDYRPNLYWRGRIWPRMVYKMVETLWRNGYHAEAEKVADDMLNLILSQPYILENYASQLPIEQFGLYGDAVPDYGWTMANAMDLMLETYKEPN